MKQLDFNEKGNAIQLDKTNDRQDRERKRENIKVLPVAGTVFT